ncbi:hypothetical protein ACK3TF_003181 [Chlorella vulgaris]
MTDEREKQLGKELSDCVMGSPWFCVAGLVLAIPLGVRSKSYMPVLYLGVAGTVLDLVTGFERCKDKREALESYLRNREAFGWQPTSVKQRD